MDQTPNSVLILLLGAIGDVVRGLAIAAQLKHVWPEVQITWAVEPISKSLVVDHPYIDRVVVFERKEGLSGYRRFISELRCHEYDLCLDLQRHLKSGLTSYLSGAATRIGFDRNNSREGNWLFQTKLIAPQVRDSPKIDQFFAFLDVLGVERPSKANFGLRPSSEEQARVRSLLQPPEECRGWVSLLIGSTWESRIWSMEYYAELAQRMWEEWRLASIIVGGPGDRDRAKSLMDSLRDTSFVCNLVGATTLRELAAVFAESRLAVGSDSGPMHIAAACGLPVVSLWGSTSPIRSGPYGWENYTLQSAIGCAPCYQKKCPGFDTLCMKTLSPAVVSLQLSRLFDEVGGLE